MSRKGTKNKTTWQRYLDDPDYDTDMSDNEKQIIAHSQSIHSTKLSEDQVKEVYPTLILSDPYESYVDTERKETIETILKSLTNRQIKILKYRFLLDNLGGMENTEFITFSEIGDMFDVTRERIRQIENKALRQLRHPSRSDILRNLVDGQVEYEIILSDIHLKLSYEELYELIDRDPLFKYWNYSDNRTFAVRRKINNWLSKTLNISKLNSIRSDIHEDWR
jgi:RNA polymerase sigma factor (sigma-70 family)